jgi:hypothetical protein
MAAIVIEGSVGGPACQPEAPSPEPACPGTGGLAELLFGSALQAGAALPSDRLPSPQSVLARLSPALERDQAGFIRAIYYWHGHSFAFRGQEEMPIYPTLSSGPSLLLGELPRRAEAEECAAYQARFQSQPSAGENAHLLAAKSLAGVLELASALGAPDSGLIPLAQEIEQGRYSDRALALVDAILAAGGGAQASQGEALTLLALLGDPDAQRYLAAAVRDWCAAHLQPPEPHLSAAEPLDISQLACVFNSGYAPVLSGERQWAVSSAFDASRGRYPRTSIHVALNHIASLHPERYALAALHTLISPAEGMFAANGLPQLLNTVDTWWPRNPGEPLLFPDATLIQAGGALPALVVSDGDIVRHKSEELTVADVLRLREMLLAEAPDAQAGDTAFGNLLLKQGTFVNLAFEIELCQEWNLVSLEDILQRGSGTGTNPWDSRLLRAACPSEQPESAPFAADLEQRLERAAVILAYQGTAHEGSSACRRLAQILQRKLNEAAVQALHRCVVRAALRGRGYEVQPGGLWAWGDSTDVTERTQALADRLGIEAGDHGLSPQAECEELVRRGVALAAQDTHGTFDRWLIHWRDLEISPQELLTTLDLKTLRCLYLSGLLSAREPGTPPFR